jgi:hypothetical protein
MSLIFEFSGMRQAKSFVRLVKNRFGLKGKTFEDAEKAEAAACFPFQLCAPVALIDRAETTEIELAIENLAEESGGKFVGT